MDLVGHQTRDLVYATRVARAVGCRVTGQALPTGARENVTCKGHAVAFPGHCGVTHARQMVTRMASTTSPSETSSAAW